MLEQVVAYWGSAAVALFGALLIGVVIDQILFLVVRARAQKRHSAALTQLATGLHGLPTGIALFIGMAIGLSRLDLTAEQVRVGELVVRSTAILVFTIFGARILGRIVRVYTEAQSSRLPSSSIFVNLARGTVWVIGGVSLLAALGISIAPLITTLGIGGLAVGLALQPTLENLFSGVQVLASRQIEPGHLIRLETGEEGIVLDVTWRNTTIRRPSNEIVIVPNSVIARSIVTNFSVLGEEYTLIVPVTVATTSDFAEIERIALEVAGQVAAEMDEALAEPEPGARFLSFSPPTAVLNVSLRVRSYPERIPVRDTLIRRLQARFSAEGIDAPPVALAQTGGKQA